MNDYHTTVQQLRGLASVKGKQQTWVGGLSDDQLYKLFLRIRNGESAKSIARQIQAEWGVCPDSSIYSISQGILKFQKRIAHITMPTIPPENKISITVAEDNTEEPADSLEENERMARQLRSRIKKIMMEEEKNRARYPYLSRDVQALMAFEKTIMKQKEWVAKYPDGDPVEKLRQKQEDEGPNREFKKYIIDPTTPEQRETINNATEYFMELLNEHAIPMEQIGSPEEFTLVRPEKDIKQVMWEMVENAKSKA
jgi:hypothetical protein